MSSTPPQIPESSREVAVENANAWVARFAPLVMDDEALTDAEVRERLVTVQKLKFEASMVQSRLSSVSQADDLHLVSTVQKAVSQLDSVEDDLRVRLGKLAPGDPDGMVNLEALNDKLAERMARQEVGIPNELAVPSRLELKTSNGSLAAGAGLGLFSFGWLSFTTFHAFMMIGGMMKAFGLAALALLGFYAIFFAVGIGMGIAGVNAASKEELVLDGFELTVKKTLGWWQRVKKYTLGPDSRAEASTTSPSTMNSKSAKVVPCIAINDAEGHTISLGAGGVDSLRNSQIEKINAYIAAQS
ncbi:MAG: hypothetical protein ABL949_00415 [Fimbriimonadaceae bacterium]